MQIKFLLLSPKSIDTEDAIKRDYFESRVQNSLV